MVFVPIDPIVHSRAWIPTTAKTFATKAADEAWDHNQFLAAVLAEEVAARETHGGQARIKTAHFPQTKTIDDFDFSFQRSIKPAQIAHLAQLDFLHEASNVVFLGLPGTGKTHLSIALGRRLVSSTRSDTSPSTPTPPRCSSR